jgi:hypothetical protein
MRRISLSIVLACSLLCIFGALFADEVTIGDGLVPQRVPIDMYWGNSLYECVYYQHELGILNGTITQISFYNAFITNLPNIQTQIWLGTTGMPNLSSAWVPAGNLTLVYDGPVDYPTGINTIPITLTTPFQYNGGTLVMMVYRPLTMWNFNSQDQFFAQFGEMGRSRKLYSDTTVFDPYTPPTGYSSVGTPFPKTTFTYTGQVINGDIDCQSLVQNPTPTQNVMQTTEVTIRNQGTSALGQGTVQILNQGHQILGSTQVEMPSPGNQSIVPVTWTPTQESFMAIYAKVIAAGDEVSGNDDSPMAILNVIGDMPYEVMIGPGDQSARLPLDFFYRNNLSQTLYPASMITNPWGHGWIRTLKYYPNLFTDNLTDKPIKIWMGETTSNDLSEGWVPVNQLQLVYDGVVDLQAGQSLLTIVLDDIYSWQGGNLVIMMQRVWDNEYYSSMDKFWGLNSAEQLTCYRSSDTETLDPNNPPYDYLTSHFYPSVTLGFLLTGDEQAYITGRVTGGGHVLPQATISLTARESTLTTNRGEYMLKTMIGLHNLSVTKDGFLPYYNDLTLNYVDNILNFNLTPSSMDDPYTPELKPKLSLYPNPFNPETTLAFSVTRDNTPVRIELFDLKGRKIKTLADGTYSQGEQRISFKALDENGLSLASGVYFIKVQNGNHRQTIKALLMK